MELVLAVGQAVDAGVGVGVVVVDELDELDEHAAAVGSASVSFMSTVLMRGAHLTAH